MIAESKIKTLQDRANWHNGNGIPSKGLGNNGDYYIDKDTSDVYLKRNGVWE